MASFVLLLLAFGGNIISRDLNLTYALLFIQGLSFGGTRIVGTVFFKEWATNGTVENLEYVCNFSSPVALILMTKWYQMIDNNVSDLELIVEVVLILTFLANMIILKESPRWLLN